MPALLHPGVYVSEVPSGARSIEGAPTSTTIFVGETERGPIGPTMIKSRTDYERMFGGYFRVRDAESPQPAPTRVLTAYAIDGFYLNGGIDGLRAAGDGSWRRGGPGHRRAAMPSRRALPGVWGNSVSVAFLAASGGSTERFRIDVVYESPRPASARLVESWDRLSTRRRRRELRRRRPGAQPLHPLGRRRRRACRTLDIAASPTGGGSRGERHRRRRGRSRRWRRRRR